VASVDQLKAPQPSSCVAGPFGSNISSKYFTHEGIPVIRGSNLTDDLTQFVSDHFVFVSPERARTYGPQHVRAGDLVFTCWGTVGQVGLIPEQGPFDEYIISNKQLKLRPDTELVDPRFLFYYFASPQMVKYVRSHAIGAAVPGINLRILKALPVVLPSVATQRRIVAILAAYDELIQNNNRRIRILEEMAHRIYHEWFAEFRYPGHTDAPLMASELGPVPEGWSIESVDAHVEVIRGRSYRGVDLADSGGLPFINLKCIARDGGFRADGLKRYVGDFKETQRAQPGDIVVAVTDMTQERRIVARAARVPDMDDEFGIVSMDLVKVVPVDLPPEYLLALLRYSDFPDRVKAHANGANVLHLHPDRIRDYRFALPPTAVVLEYQRQIGPVQRLSEVLATSNNRLRAARDLLLPRLISGQTDVSNLDLGDSEDVA